MRIERIELDGFGRFHDAHWELGQGLTVLVGANEAGKTTLLNGLRALLFGFESSRDGRTWYPALAGGRRGGRLALRTAVGEEWTVERHGDRGGGGALAVRAPNGNQGGQETLDRLLHGADRDLFNNIFAFGLGELQTFASLSADGVRGRIYGAGAGLGGTSAVDVERRLRQRLDAIFLPRGSQRPMNRLLARIEELRHEIADLARQPEEHAAAHREREELLGRVASLRAQAHAARERSARLGHLRDAGPIAVELEQLQSDLDAGDPSLEALPEDVVPVLDRLLAEVTEARAVLDTIDADLSDVGRGRAAIDLDPEILAVGDEVTAAVREVAQRAGAEPRRRDLEAALHRHEAAVAEQLARVGGWDEGRLLGLDDSIQAVEATRDHERRLAGATAAQAESEQRRRRLAGEVTELESQAGSASDGEEDLAVRLDALRRLESLRSGTTQVGAGLGTGAGLALAVVAGMFGLVGGLVLEAPLAGVAAGIALAGIVYLLVRPRSGTEESGDGAELLARAGLAPGSGPADIASTRDELAVARARVELSGAARTRLAARRGELDRSEQEAASATDALDAATRAWHDWLAAAALPADASPEAARQLLTAAGVARRAAGDRDHHGRELEVLDRDDAAWAARADALLASLGSAGGTGRDARIVAAGDRLDRAREAERRAGELAERESQLAARRQAALGRVEEREAAVTAHLASIGCPDPDGLRRRARAAGERRALRDAARAHRQRLAMIAGPDGVDTLVAEARAIDPAELDVAEVEARRELERIESEERDATARIGALEARMHQLEAADEVGSRRQELAMLEGQAAAMAREWAVGSLALRLLEETRSRYERERQPDVVRAAEGHFERITGGRYARIVAPPGDASVRVETEGGESRTTEELSRGTGEQLYLALRFGLIEEFARHAEPLPVVMDDILVNFDADRAARAAAAITDLADRHQVVYFTCHPWTAELLDPEGTRTVPLG